MKLFSAKSFVGSYFIGKFDANEKLAAITINKGLGGFDHYEDAEGQLETMRLEKGGETYLIVQVVAEYRTKTNLISLERAQ